MYGAARIPSQGTQKTRDSPTPSLCPEKGRLNVFLTPEVAHMRGDAGWGTSEIPPRRTSSQRDCFFPKLVMGAECVAAGIE